mmetsp:Transcript_2504/g.4311  ORF Transcript_2504/g.4311 Transcript_2504/m.4311 type:complete len:130 (-) Transcript_2504:110-499(-)
MGIGIPVQILHESMEHVVTVETRNGDLFRGKVLNVEDNMNVLMQKVTVTRRDGKLVHLENVFIRGSKVRFMVLPDILAESPVFKRQEMMKEAKGQIGRGLGRGRGITGASRGRSRGRGLPPRPAPMGRG